jgi:hypothetical protein
MEKKTKLQKNIVERKSERTKRVYQNVVCLGCLNEEEFMCSMYSYSPGMSICLLENKMCPVIVRARGSVGRARSPLDLVDLLVGFIGTVIDGDGRFRPRFLHGRLLARAFRD